LSTTIPMLSSRLSAMRRIYRMSPRCNNGRFATPKQELRAVCQIALLNNRQSGRITSNPEVIAGSVSENALFVIWP
jgi:hypothetical protein